MRAQGRGLAAGSRSSADPDRDFLNFPRADAAPLGFSPRHAGAPGRRRQAKWPDGRADAVGRTRSAGDPVPRRTPSRPGYTGGLRHVLGMLRDLLAAFYQAYLEDARRAKPHGPLLAQADRPGSRPGA